MNASQFCEKYGDKYASKIPKWYAAGYLGNTTKDKKTGHYDIPDDIPLPFSANPIISTIPTLMRDILQAASEMRSLYPSMYPKIPAQSFCNQIQDMVDANLIRVCYTKSGDPYLELRQAGVMFLNTFSEKDRTKTFNKLHKLIAAGYTLIQALSILWPMFQSF